MLKFERQRYIENEINKKGSVTISELSKVLEVSEETIRRDLKELEMFNKLIRTHGGAYISEVEDKGIPIELRAKFLSNEKELMADFIVKNIINENETILLDSSTTCYTLAKKIVLEDLKITIATNSLRIATLFESKPENTQLIMLGGKFRKRSSSFIGYPATNSINKLLADKCFISCPAIDITHGLLDNNQFEAQIRLSMILPSAKVYLVADHTKFSDSAEHIITSLSKVNSIITDKYPIPEWENLFNEMEIPFSTVL